MSHKSWIITSRGREEHYNRRIGIRTQCEKSRKRQIQESHCSSQSLCWWSHKRSHSLQRHSRICNVNHPSDIINITTFLIFNAKTAIFTPCFCFKLYLKSCLYNITDPKLHIFNMILSKQYWLFLAKIIISS